MSVCHCWQSTKLTVSVNGDMIFALSIASWGDYATTIHMYRCLLSRQQPQNGCEMIFLPNRGWMILTSMSPVSNDLTSTIKFAKSIKVPIANCYNSYAVSLMRQLSSTVKVAGVLTT